MKQILGIKKLRVGKERQSVSTDNNKGSEVMSGHLVLIQVMGQRTLHIPVFVKVYRSRFEHYAVVYKDQKYSMSTYINLKNSVVMYNENCNTELRVVPHNFEGTVIVFDTKDKNTVPSWKSAFEDCEYTTSPTQSISPSLSPVIPRSPVLPTLEEAIEEE